MTSSVPSIAVYGASGHTGQFVVQAFAGCGVVIHCAGPFMDTAAPVAQAALQAGAHYIDVTAEQPSAQATFADLQAPAAAAGRVVVPAAGFYGGLADLPASSPLRAPSTRSPWPWGWTAGGPPKARA